MNNLVEVKVEKKLGTISSNLDKVEESVNAYVKEYAGYAVSEDTVADSKKVLADIRRQKKALDDERKQIKKEWNAPYAEFEKRANEIIALYDKPINLINSQLSKFEEDRKEKKRKQIREIYEECEGHLAEYLPFEKIYNPQWENVSVTLKSIKESIQQQFDQVSLSIATIQSLESEFEDKGLEEYKRSLDMQKAVQVMNQYKRQKEEILARQEAERKAKEERERMEAERAEQERILAEKKAEEEQKKAEEQAEIAEATREFEEIALGIVENDSKASFQTVEETIEEEFEPVQEITVTIQIKADPFRAEAVKKLLESNNIEYEVISDGRE